MDVFMGLLRSLRFADSHDRSICRAHYERIGGCLRLSLS